MINKKFKCICYTIVTISVSGILLINLSNEEGPRTTLTSELNARVRGPIRYDHPDLVNYVKHSVLVRPSQLPYNLSSNLLYSGTKHYYSWGSINKALKSLFSDTKNGFFVEAGALDGEYLSNSLWLERTLNWTGLLIEPVETNYRLMVWKRRKAWLSHSCLSNEKYPKEVTFVSTSEKKTSNSFAPMAARGSSLEFSYYAGLSTNKKWSKYYLSLEKAYSSQQCYPLYTSLLALNISTVDFLSLDLQGAEIEVFNTIPLDKVFIRTFIIEDAERKTNYKLIKHFNDLGFDLFTANASGPDYFFINRNDSILIKKAKKLGMVQRFIDQRLHFETPLLPFGMSYVKIKYIQDELLHGREILLNITQSV